mmetsp:Transcript_16735/g.63600  ORF Transcript_16735/g.63600 Transcript_16735/m.63600 type:complete len:236 (-) Transcript_16735:73-780(-)
MNVLALPQGWEKLLLNVSGDGIIHPLIHSGNDPSAALHVGPDLHHLPGWEVAEAKLAEALLLIELLHGGQRLRQRRVLVRGVQVEDLDVVHAHGLQGICQLLLHVLAREVLVVRGEGIGLGRHDHIALELRSLFVQQLAQQLLGAPRDVHSGRIQLNRLGQHLEGQAQLCFSAGELRLTSPGHGAQDCSHWRFSQAMGRIHDVNLTPEKRLGDAQRHHKCYESPATHVPQVQESV